MTVFLVPSSVAQQGTVRIGAYSVDGDVVTIPIVLEGDVGVGVAAMDFRLRYDAEVFEPIGIETGQAVADADKLVQTNLVRPGEYIVLMFGMNQTALTSGDLAHVTMRMIEAPEMGSTRLTVSNTTMSTANATALDSRGTGRTIRFDDGLPTEAVPIEPEPDGEDDAPELDGELSEPGTEDGGQSEDPGTLAEDGSAGAQPYQTALGGGGGALVRGTGNRANVPDGHRDGPRSSMRRSARRVGNVKDVMNRIREADDLRSQLPQAGTGDSDDDDGAADDGGSAPGAEDSKTASPPSSPPDGQGVATTVAKAARASATGTGREGERNRAGGRGEENSVEGHVDADPAAQSHGNGPFRVGLAVLAFGAAAIAGVLAFRRKFLS